MKQIITSWSPASLPTGRHGIQPGQGVPPPHRVDVPGWTSDLQERQGLSQGRQPHVQVHLGQDQFMPVGLVNFMPQSILIDTIHSLSLNLSASSSELESSWGRAGRAVGSSPCASKAIPASGYCWLSILDAIAAIYANYDNKNGSGHHKIICLRTSALRKGGIVPSEPQSNEKDKQGLPGGPVIQIITLQ